MAFFCASKKRASGQVSAAMLSSAELLFSYFILLWICSETSFAITCPAFNKRNTFSSHLGTCSCRFVIHSFLLLRDAMTLKHWGVQEDLGKSSRNQMETQKLIVVITLDAESYFQHTLAILRRGTKCPA